MVQPLTVKYRPKSLGEVIGNRKAKETFSLWLKDWGRSKKKAALLYGPAGIGKTVTVEATAHDLDMDIVEINASDKRTGPLLEQLAGMASTQSSLYGKKRLILLDEVDGINLREDRGAVPTIVEMIKESKVPIVFTANDPWNPKIAALREESALIQFRRLSRKGVLPYLREICETEGILAGDDALTLLIEKNRGDLRAALNDLEAFSLQKKKLDVDDILLFGERDRGVSIFEALTSLFTSKECVTARRTANAVDMNYEMLFEWIYENTPRRIDDPEALSQAMESLAKAELYLNRVKRKQAWNLIPYVIDLMTAGVALSQKEMKPRFIPMKFPERIRQLSRMRALRALREGICKKISVDSHISIEGARIEYLPYFQIIFKNDPRMSEKLALRLKLTEKEREYLGSL